MRRVLTALPSISDTLSRLPLVKGAPHAPLRLDRFCPICSVCAGQSAPGSRGLADAGDPRAVGLLEDWARHTARAVTDLVDALDLDHVVFGGPLWPRLATTFLRVVPDVVRGRAVGAAIHPIAVTGTRLGPDGAAVGAASLVLDHAFSPRSATLLLAD